MDHLYAVHHTQFSSRLKKNKKILFNENHHSNEDVDINDFSFQKFRLGQFPTTIQEQTALEDVLSASLATSTVVKATNLSQLIASERLHEIFSICGQITALEIRNEGNARHALVTFRSAEEAEKSLAVNGLQIGNQALNVSKWFDRQTVERLSFLHIHEAQKINDRAIAPEADKMDIHFHDSDKNSFEIKTKQSINCWKEKQMLQYDMMEKYAALVAASRYKFVDPKKLLDQRS
eukprot:gnl/TRDRNA2_/TRDRNA2_177441_c1_seq1.p1 gnl/TRDRNA2_/TRDRNA2_177441_c1~~gnl/TRDRNA2_/TRDRNA2_177441_c1_seq1.p1  ORF type:complete len:234 (+),score=1.20 gnl/TRDRNA2_/TRDRNA2_177441_c1_seq1:322-1023(+)